MGSNGQRELALELIERGYAYALAEKQAEQISFERAKAKLAKRKR